MKRYILLFTAVLLLETGSITFGFMPLKKNNVLRLEHYIAAQEALAVDDFSNARKAILALEKVSKGELKKLVETAGKAGNLKEFRKTFKAVSEKMAGMILPDGYVVVYCPIADDLKGAYWIQRQGIILNPYLGSLLLHCGSFKKYPGKKTNLYHL